jgi:hypothetical protein
MSKINYEFEVIHIIDGKIVTPEEVKKHILDGNKKPA